MGSRQLAQRLSPWSSQYRLLHRSQRCVASFLHRNIASDNKRRACAQVSAMRAGPGYFIRLLHLDGSARLLQFLDGALGVWVS